VTGVLPICVGEATKIVQYVTNFGKCYQAEITIGISTTTEDSDGDIVQTKPVKQPITRDEILKLPFAMGINMAHNELEKVLSKIKK